MDYYREYLEIIDEVLTDFIHQIKHFLVIDNISTCKAVKNKLWTELILNGMREEYNNNRKKDGEIVELKNEIAKYLIMKYWVTGFDFIEGRNNNDYSYYNFLEADRTETIVFCLNTRQIEYWIPILSQISDPVLMLCNFDSKDCDFHIDNLTIIDLRFIETKFLYNNYLETYFKRIAEYTNLFIMLIEVLRPTRVLVMEGCHYETELLAAICRQQSIETVCYQQGWPGLIHTRFRDMSYDRFITWGDGFNELWRRHNPILHIEAGQYLYPTCKEKRDDGVTFFLQAPMIIIDTDYFEQILQLAFHTALHCKHTKVLIREHPEFRLSNGRKQIFEKLSNVEFVSDKSLLEVFERTLISVSMFSSTIIESLAHHSIPFIFDPTTNGGYYPSISDWGIEVNTLEVAKVRLTELINNESEIEEMNKRILKYKDVYFVSPR